MAQPPQPPADDLSGRWWRSGRCWRLATFAVLTEMQWLGGGRMLRPVLLADFVYALVVAAFVAQRGRGDDRRAAAASAGSKLHMRLVRFFTAIALIPTILVAVFATITLNFGLEGWFSDRVHNVVANSMAAAQAYEEEHRVTLQTDARSLGISSTRRRRRTAAAGGELRDLLTRGQQQMQRRCPRPTSSTATASCARGASGAISSGTPRRRRRTSPRRGTARSSSSRTGRTTSSGRCCS